MSIGTFVVVLPLHLRRCRRHLPRRRSVWWDVVAGHRIGRILRETTRVSHTALRWHGVGGRRGLSVLRDSSWQRSRGCRRRSHFGTLVRWVAGVRRGPQIRSRWVRYIGGRLCIGIEKFESLTDMARVSWHPNELCDVSCQCCVTISGSLRFGQCITRRYGEKDVP